MGVVMVPYGDLGGEFFVVDPRGGFSRYIEFKHVHGETESKLLWLTPDEAIQLGKALTISGLTRKYLQDADL